MCLHHSIIASPLQGSMIVASHLMARGTLPRWVVDWVSARARVLFPGAGCAAEDVCTCPVCVACAMEPQLTPLALSTRISPCRWMGNPHFTRRPCPADVGGGDIVYILSLLNVLVPAPMLWPGRSRVLCEPNRRAAEVCSHQQRPGEALSLFLLEKQMPRPYSHMVLSCPCFTCPRQTEIDRQSDSAPSETQPFQVRGMSSTSAVEQQWRGY